MFNWTTNKVAAASVILATGAIGALIITRNEPDSHPLSPYLEAIPSEFSYQTDPENESAPTEAESHQQLQNSIAECMKLNGQSYHPSDGPRPKQTLPEYGSVEFAQTYGYGISTLAFHQDTVGANLVGYTPASSHSDTNQNPNRTHFESLSQQEQIEYLIALTGSPDPDNLEQVLAGAITTGGCHRHATDQANNLNQQISGFYEKLDTQIERLNQDIQNHPEVQEHQRAIVACLLRFKLQYKSPEEYAAEYTQELQKINDQLQYSDTPNTPPQLPAQARAQLADLQKSEITHAIANNKCGNTIQKVQELNQLALKELLPDFIETNKKVLLEIKAGSN